MKSLLRLALLGFLSTSLLHAAHYELSASSEGSGTVQVGSSGDQVSKANVLLRRDGKFSIGLVGGNDTRFEGTWTPSGRDDARLELTRADGRYAEGSGEIQLRTYRGGTEIERLVITGENDKGRSINARFSGPRYVPAPVPAPPRVVLSALRAGRGRLEIGGRPYGSFSSARVQLTTDGRATVQTSGPSALRYEGTWTNSGETTATLNVVGGVNGERLRGIVRHRGDRFWRIELSGTRASRYYSLDFDAGR